MSSVTLEASRATERRQQSAGWWSVWFTCAALFYPLYWLSGCLLWVLPAVVQAAIPGYRLTVLRLGPVDVFAAAMPRVPSPHPGVAWIESLGTVTVPLVAAWALYLFAVRAARASALPRAYRTRRLLLASLTMAVIGNAQVMEHSRSILMWGRIDIAQEWQSAILAGLMILGLRWMAECCPGQSTWRRCTWLLGFFVAPLALAVLVLVAVFVRRLSLLPVALLAPGVALSLIVGLLPLRRSPPEMPDLKWSHAAFAGTGALVFVLLVSAGGRAVTDAFQQRRLAEHRAAMASYPSLPAGTPYPKAFFQRGVTFTAEFPAEYASEEARLTLETLPRYGINAIALVPYGWSSLRPPRVRLQGEHGWESDEGVEDLARVAHARGMKVMLKPAIWHALGLQFSAATDRAEWFAQYGRFLDHYARLATRIHADVFCIGGEFSHLTPYDSEWRRLIAATRQVYPGQLVYAANFGEEFESITFWGDLDYIGLQEYYPLPDDFSAAAIVKAVEAVHSKFGRPVIFTEVGFASLANAHRQPWDDAPRTHSPAEQARCYDAIFRAFYQQPWFAGMYWWKFGTRGLDGRDAGSFLPSRLALDVLERWYTRGGR